MQTDIHWSSRWVSLAGRSQCDSLHSACPFLFVSPLPSGAQDSQPSYSPLQTNSEIQILIELDLNCAQWTGEMMKWKGERILTVINLPSPCCFSSSALIWLATMASCSCSWTDAVWARANSFRVCQAFFRELMKPCFRSEPILDKLSFNSGHKTTNKWLFNYVKFWIITKKCLIHTKMKPLSPFMMRNQNRLQLNVW